MKNMEINGKLLLNFLKESYYMLVRSGNDVKNHFYSVIRKNLRSIAKYLGYKKTTEKIRNIKPVVLAQIFDVSNKNL